MDTSPSANKSSNKPAPPPKPKVQASVSWRQPEVVHNNGAATRGLPTSESRVEQLGKRSPCTPVGAKSPVSVDTGNASASGGEVKHPTPRKKNTQSLVKPALLPKPQLTQRHPDLVLSTKRSPVQLPTTSQPVQVFNTKIPPIVVKAPVARLDEFEASTPLRPPRSPKNKIFPHTGPFVDGKPAIPIKKRSPISPEKPRPVTLFQPRSESPTLNDIKSKIAQFNTPIPEVKRKSASLGRYAELLKPTDLECEPWNSYPNGSKSAPVRPPRKCRRKIDPQTGEVILGHALCRSISLFSSIEEAEKNIPIYAEVNYNLKRNRRQNTVDSADVEHKSPIEPVSFTFDVESSVSDANLNVKSSVSPNIQNFCDNITPSVLHTVSDSIFTASDRYNNTAEKNKYEEQSVNNVAADSAAIKLDSSLRDKQKVDKVMGNSEYSSPITAQPSAIISEPQAEPQQTLDSTDVQDITDVQASVTNVSSPNISVPSQSTSSEAYQLEVQETEHEAKQVTEKLGEKWSSSEAIEDSSKLEYLSAKASLHSSLSDIMPDGLAENELEESKASAAKTTEDKGETSNQRSDISIVFEGLDSIGCEASFMDTEDANETKDLVTNFPHSEERINISCQSNGSLLSMNDPRKNGEKERARSLPHLNKSEVPSHGKLVLNRSIERRRRFRGDQWCDEGELSTGVLGDVDSSDAARQSSLDDVGGSDTEDSAPMMRKLRSLTNFTKNMLRKSGRKSKERKESLQSQFYCNKPSNSSEGDDTSKDSTLGDNESSTLQHTSPAAEEQGAQSSIENVYRPSYAHADPHSESENEEEFFDSSTVQGSSDPPLSEQQKQAKKAFQIAEEIMTSERVFVDVLKLLSVDFHAFVESANKDHKTPVIAEADLSKIFNHLPQLLQLNNELLKDLEQRISSWSKHEKIADVIVKKGPFLKLYTSYIQNFENQCTFLDECCQKNTTFAKTVQDFELSPRCKKLSLKHYMLKPVQRVPQYRLLLENYLKCLQPDSLDYADTNTALQIVCDVAEHANRSMKEGDALSKLLQLQSLLGHYELIKPGRILKREGELLKVCRKGMQPRYFILLNDCLLYTTYYGSGLPSGLKVNYEIPVQQMKVTVSSTEDYSNEFSIISVTRSFTLVASSPEVMQAWVDDLQAAIQEKASKESTFLHARLASDPEASSWRLGKEAPVWIPDQRVTMCQICTTEFTVTFRRHHCRACGKVVCGDCSAYKAPLQYMKFRAARVCNDCFSVLQQEFKDDNFLTDGLSKQEKDNALEVARLHFNRATPTPNKKSKKYIPQRLKEVSANDAGCQISGWLQRHMRRSWKKMWFVLKDQVLYMYKASEDVVALESLPVLGYEVKLSDGQQYVGIDAKLLFMLTHKGQPQLVFHADNVNSAQRWIKALQEATTLQV